MIKKVNKVSKKKKDIKIKIPCHWRIGQTIFNFLQWLVIEKDISANQSYRMGDPFYLSDKDFKKYYKEFLKTI